MLYKMMQQLHVSQTNESENVIVNKAWSNLD